MLIGYARVSTDNQSLDVQIAALEKAGCEMIYIEYESGKNLKKQKELNRCLASLQPGDTLVVHQIDRLGRNLMDLLYIVNFIKESNVSFKSILQAVDTDDAFGNLMFQQLASFAEYERRVISQRTKKALDLKKRNNVALGTPHSLTPTQAKELIRRYNAKTPIPEIMEMFGVSYRTVHRYVARAEEYGCKVNRR